MRIPSVAFVLFLQIAFTSVGFSQQKLQSEVKLGLSHTLSFKGVSEDLELTDEQKEKLFGLWTEVQTKLEHAFREYKANYSPRFKGEALKELNDQLADGIKEVREFELERLEEVLLPQQMNRLQQIRFQILKRDSDGLQKLNRELSLTKDQISQINKVKVKLKGTLRELQQYSREEQLTPNEIKEEVAAVRKENREKLLAILTSTQRSKLKQLEGEPFEIQIGTPKKKDD